MPNGCLMLCNIGRVGDTILRNSILDSAVRTYATVDYICGRHNADCIRSDSRLNRVIIYQNSPAGFIGVLKAALSRRYDAYIDLKDDHSSTSLVIAQMFRSSSKTGCNGKYFRPFHRNVQSIHDPHAHTVERMRRIGQLAGLQTGEYKPSLILTPGSIAWFRSNYAWNRPFIFLNLSATHPNRMWPVQSWARYVRGCDLADQTIFINGLPKHQEMVHQLCRELPGAVAFQPKCFMDVAAAVADARLVLTVDTGVVHACSALDKPVVAFFQAVRGVIGNAPLSTCHLMIRPQTGRFVPDIDPEQAIAETLRHGLP
jgi:ADP-heptose:LPS heptosyltransferase